MWPLLHRIRHNSLLLIIVGLVSVLAVPAKAAVVGMGDIAQLDANGVCQPFTIPANNMVTGTLLVACTGRGALRVDEGSTLTIGQSFFAGFTTSSQGAITLQGNNSRLIVTVDSVIGNGGIGSFTHIDGTHSVGGNFVLGNGFSGNGSYTLSDGMLTVTGSGTVGNGGTGIFIHDDGTYDTGGLAIAQQTGSNGTYNLNGGVLNIRLGGQTTVGDSGTAVFNQNSGDHTTDALFVGKNAGGNGTYNLSDGRLIVRDTTTVGNAGTGVFAQTGGTHTTGNDVVLGGEVGGHGEYTIFAGGQLSVGDQTTVGDKGTGVFMLFNGIHEMNGSLVLGNEATGDGTYDLVGGHLIVRGETIVGLAGAGLFIQSGGEAISGALSVATTGPGRMIITGTGSDFSVPGMGADSFVGSNKGEGSLEVLAGATLNLFDNKLTIGDRFIAMGPTTGAGSVTVDGKGSILKAKEVDVGGNVNLDLKGTLMIANGGTVDADVNVNRSGTLVGRNGVDVKKSVNDLGGKIVAAPGLFQIEGSYTQVDASILDILFLGDGKGGVDFGFLQITGTAGFATGSILEFDFDNFLPKAGDRFVFLTASSVLLAPSDFNCELGIFVCEVFGVAPGFRFDVESTATSLILEAFTNAQGVPEPSTWILVAVGVFGLMLVRISLRGRVFSRRLIK